MAIKFIKAKHIINEAYDVFQVGDEDYVQKQLVKILKNTKGDYGPYHYPKYAKRLEKYALKIVPSKDVPEKHIKGDPMFTAAISFDDGIVYIGDSFLQKGSDGKLKPELLNMLIVLIRHELAHNLLMHQIRMMHKLGDKRYNDKLKFSQSLHKLLNIIMDFEISNKKYKPEDKKIVKSMVINEKDFRGLVTEDRRPGWETLTLEEMYDKLTEELKAINNQILTNRKLGKDEFEELPSELLEPGRISAVEHDINSAITLYADTTTPSVIYPTFEKFIEKDAFKNKWNPRFKKVLLDGHKAITEAGVSQEALKDMLFQIADSKFLEPVDLVNPDTGEIIIEDITTTEEKYTINNLIKCLLGNVRHPTTLHTKKIEHSKEYKEIYNEIIKSFGKKGEYTAEEIIDLLNKVGGGMDF